MATYGIGSLYRVLYGPLGILNITLDYLHLIEKEAENSKEFLNDLTKVT